MTVERFRGVALEQLADEHHRLRDVLSSVRETIAERSVAPPKVIELLVELTLVVKSHFDHEETGGFFSDIVGQAPRLKPRAESLSVQHADLCESLRGLRRRAESLKSDGDWQELADGLASFTRQFHEHETRENSLMLDAFGDEIGTKD